MRIYGGRGRSNLGYVNVYLMCNRPRINDPIRLYVDTGASRTTIADRDAIRLGIDYEQLEKSQAPVIGIGCSAIENYLMRNALLAFRVSGGGYHIETLDVVTVLKHEPQNENERMIVDQCPSLLGIDLLKKYAVRFTDKSVILEK